MTKFYLLLSSLFFAPFLFGKNILDIKSISDSEGVFQNQSHLSGEVNLDKVHVSLHPTLGPVFSEMPPIPSSWINMGIGIGTGTVYAMTVSGFDVYIGGSFTSAGGIGSTQRIAKWNSLTQSWSPLGSGLNATVYAIAVSGNDVYVGGAFTDAGGNTSADRVARWNTTSGTWNALGSGISNNTVNAIATNGSDVYIGGNFLNAGGNANADRIGRWNATSSTWNALLTGLNSTVNAIAISGSNVYIGGAFFSPIGNSSHRIAVWNSGTSTWSTLGSGVSGIVRAIKTNGADIYVGGDFTNAGGVAGTNHIARWNGTTWSALGTGIAATFNTVYTIDVFGTDVYIGGNFNDAGGNVNADRIAQWDGTSWNEFVTLMNTGSVYAIKITSNDMFIAGNFTSASGNFNANRVARLGAAPLPIELSAFDGRLEDGKVFLEWETSSEIDNDYFEIEHSRDGRTFRAIGKVKGQGTTFTAHRYEFVHENPSSGENYYRLKQTDYSGAFEYSPVLNFTFENARFEIFPNPTNGRVEIKAEKFQSGRLLVTSATGTLVGNFDLSNLNAVDLSNYPKGVYFFSFQSDSGERITKQIVKR